MRNGTPVMIGGRGKLQCSANWLDPKGFTAFLNEPKVREAKAIICEMGGRAAAGSAEAVPRCLSHLGKIRARHCSRTNGGQWLALPQDHIGLPKFAHLALKLFDPDLLCRCLARSFATITLDLAHPKRIGCPANTPIYPRSPSAPPPQTDTHRGVPRPIAPHARGTRVKTASRSSSFVHVP
jgi:hypothetical protein